MAFLFRPGGEAAAEMSGEKAAAAQGVADVPVVAVFADVDAEARGAFVLLQAVEMSVGSLAGRVLLFPLAGFPTQAALAAHRSVLGCGGGAQIPGVWNRRSSAFALCQAHSRH